MPPFHRQVPVLDFTCDEEIAELITLINTCGIDTVNSCQDNNAGRGTTPRVWVEINAEDLSALLEILDQPAETQDRESLSNRIAADNEPDWNAFRDNRAWHYKTNVTRTDGELDWPTISIRFPRTDLDEVVTRLTAARAILEAATSDADAADPEPETGSRRLLHLHLDDSAVIEVEHFYGTGGTCHCGEPAIRDPGRVGLIVKDSDGDIAYAAMNASQALLTADRLTRGAHLILESDEDPPDIEREAARYSRTSADTQ
jgi:hypothetical protein